MLAVPSTDTPAPLFRTFRVRGIPIASTKADVQSVLESEYKDQTTGVTIKSLARETHGRTQVATIHFDRTPLKLSSGQDQFQHEGRPWTIDDYFDGLTVLHCPLESDHRVDIVAVSGLGGHAYGSFKERGGNYMWLSDSLPEHIPTARVAIYGYESGLPNSTSFQNLTDLGTSFKTSVEELEQYGNGLTKTLIFIAHSLGGLIVKEVCAMVQMYRSKSEKLKTTLHSIYGAIFFGVPNDGLDIAALRPMVGDGPNRPFLESLGHVNSDVLRSQNREFLETFDTENGPEIYCFYETSMSRTPQMDEGGKWNMTGDYVVLVSRSSAIHGQSRNNEDNVHPLPRDHSELVKFSANSSDYNKVLGTLERMIQRAAVRSQSRQRVV
ncbi:hypothetical protein GQ53DRAFT_666276 [Thozetella sp. PMI_491]|nr:hypothetical protein GQ53DRAFT_666276 [Thozetella sp. PMI_491]